MPSRGSSEHRSPWGRGRAGRLRPPRGARRVVPGDRRRVSPDPPTWTSRRPHRSPSPVRRWNPAARSSGSLSTGPRTSSTSIRPGAESWSRGRSAMVCADARRASAAACNGACLQRAPSSRAKRRSSGAPRTRAATGSGKRPRVAGGGPAGTRRARAPRPRSHAHWPTPDPASGSIGAARCMRPRSRPPSRPCGSRLALTVSQDVRLVSPCEARAWSWPTPTDRWTSPSRSARGRGFLPAAGRRRSRCPFSKGPRRSEPAAPL